MNEIYKSAKWLSSKDAKAEARIKSCDLKHYRLQGKLKFIKKGNSFFYDKNSIVNLKK